LKGVFDMTHEEIITKVIGGEMSLKDALNSVAVWASGPKPESKVQIVIAPRGWVFIGYTYETDKHLVIERANVIRVWGTTKGIGELIAGPLKDTKLDPCGTTRIPLGAVLAQIDAEESKWQSKI
jgi:hypothetical protein